MIVNIPQSFKQAVEKELIMKVSDGFWMTRKGYNVDFSEEIYGVSADENSVTVHTTHQWIHNRGMTLGGPVLTIRFTSTLENSIKVTITHFSGTVAHLPEFELSEDNGFRPTIKHYESGKIIMISGKTSVTIPPVKSPWGIEFRYDGKLLTRSGWRTTSIIQRERVPDQSDQRFFSRSDNGGNTYIREMLGISAGESIYGFGEKFTPFVKNGQTVEVCNNDGGTCTEQSYKSVPFFVSSRNYGIFVNHPELVDFEVASENVSRTAFTVQGEKMEYFLFGGDSVSSVIERYTALTGRPALPPAWSFGLWLSTSFTTDYDENTVNSFIDGMEHRNIPLDVFHFDCFWMKEQEWCSFQWDRDMFPDPKAMIQRLKNRGLKVCVWINPYVSQRAPIFCELMKKGYFLRNKDGSVFQTDLWQPAMAIIDFTNRDARKWFGERIRELAELGIDAVKTDFGERIPTDVVYSDGSDPFRMHNYYSYLYNKTVWDALSEAKGDACLFARAATAGCQKFPVHWGGDCFSDYYSMAETLRGGLSLCMSGFGYFSHDISGFEAKGTPDLYKRWLAFGLMSTHSRLHGSNSYRVPWNFDEESCKVAEFFVKLKGSLMPYLFANAVHTHKTGIPMMRAMVLDFGFDRNTHAIDTQYMLGDSLLCAPVFSEDGDCEFYLPDCGTWTDILTGETLSGGRWYSRKYDYFSMPLFAKPDSVIVFGNFKNSADYDYTDNVTIKIYGISDGHTVETEIYDSEGNQAFRVTAERSGNVLKAAINGSIKKYRIEAPSQEYEIIIK